MHREAELWERVDSELAQRALPGAWGHFAITLLLGFFTNFGRDHRAIMGAAFAGTFLSSAVRLVLIRRMKNIYFRYPREWRGGVLACILLSAVCWSLLSCVAIRSYGYSNWNSLIVFFCLVATAALGVVPLASSLPAMRSYLALLLVPSILMDFARGGYDGYAMGMAASALCIFLLVQGAILHKEYWRRITDHALLNERTCELQREEENERRRNRVLEMMAANQPLTDVLNGVCDLTERQCPGLVCAISVKKKDRIFTAAAPHAPDVCALIRGIPIGPMAGSCGSAAYWGKPVITGDIATDPLWDELKDTALSLGLRACWSIPALSASGQVLGTLALYSRTPRMPSAAELGVLERASRLAALAVEHRQLYEQLKHQAYHDSLTGLPNRLLFADRLQQALAHARRENRRVALLFIDLDRFKQVNDTLSHRIGDLYLQEVARRLQSSVRQTDTLARMGGDEFTAILTDLESREGAEMIARHVLHTFHAPFHVDGCEIRGSASIGISVYPDDGRDAELILKHADYALHRAKDQGRSQYQHGPREAAFQPEATRSLPGPGMSQCA